MNKNLRKLAERTHDKRVSSPSAKCLLFADNDKYHVSVDGADIKLGSHFSNMKRLLFSDSLYHLDIDDPKPLLQTDFNVARQIRVGIDAVCTDGQGKIYVAEGNKVFDYDNYDLLFEAEDPVQELAASDEKIWFSYCMGEVIVSADEYIVKGIPQFKNIETVTPWVIKEFDLKTKKIDEQNSVECTDNGFAGAMCFHQGVLYYFEQDTVWTYDKRVVKGAVTMDVSHKVRKLIAKFDCNGKEMVSIDGSLVALLDNGKLVTVQGDYKPTSLEGIQTMCVVPVSYFKEGVLKNE